MSHILVLLCVTLFLCCADASNILKPKPAPQINNAYEDKSKCIAQHLAEITQRTSALPPINTFPHVAEAQGTMAEAQLKAIMANINPKQTEELMTEIKHQQVSGKPKIIVVQPQTAPTQTEAIIASQKAMIEELQKSVSKQAEQLNELTSTHRETPKDPSLTPPCIEKLGLSQPSPLELKPTTLSVSPALTNQLSQAGVHISALTMPHVPPSLSAPIPGIHISPSPPSPLPSISISGPQLSNPNSEIKIPTAPPPQVSTHHQVTNVHFTTSSPTPTSQDAALNKFKCEELQKSYCPRQVNYIQGAPCHVGFMIICMDETPEHLNYDHLNQLMKVMEKKPLEDLNSITEAKVLVWITETPFGLAKKYLILQKACSEHIDKVLLPKIPPDKHSAARTLLLAECVKRDSVIQFTEAAAEQVLKTVGIILIPMPNLEQSCLHFSNQYCRAALPNEVGNCQKTVHEFCKSHHGPEHIDQTTLLKEVVKYFPPSLAAVLAPTPDATPKPKEQEASSKCTPGPVNPAPTTGDALDHSSKLWQCADFSRKFCAPSTAALLTECEVKTKETCLCFGGPQLMTVQSMARLAAKYLPPATQSACNQKPPVNVNYVVHPPSLSLPDHHPYLPHNLQFI